MLHINLARESSSVNQHWYKKRVWDSQSVVLLICLFCTFLQSKLFNPSARFSRLIMKRSHLHWRELQIVILLRKGYERKGNNPSVSKRCCLALAISRSDACILTFSSALRFLSRHYCATNRQELQEEEIENVRKLPGTFMSQYAEPPPDP